MSKRQSFGSQFERLKSLAARKPLDEPKRPVIEGLEKNAPEARVGPLPAFLEQSRSTSDSGQASQSEIQPLSIANSVSEEQTAARIGADLARVDNVRDGLCAKRTGSTLDTVETRAEGFTRVPHSLLRGEAKFSDPLDFMVYMHLFTYSHGFGRAEAHMSQSQLERFTGAAKNTIKRSLDRLTKDGWIKCVEEYERARMSRKWRVAPPAERIGRGGPKGKRTVSFSDSDGADHCPPQAGILSAVNPLEGSKVDSFIERESIEKSKNSLSAEHPDIRVYFSELKPFGKRESEWKAYFGLRQDYQEEDIATCLRHLLDHGIPPNGVTCHSPMGFLSKAMGELLRHAQAARERLKNSEDCAKSEETDRARRMLEDESASREAEMREAAFLKEFPDKVSQDALLAEWARAFPMFGAGGPAVRSLAIGAWWASRCGDSRGSSVPAETQRVGSG